MKQLRSINHEHGAALVVGLLMLVILTLLAISGMNSATLEFVMAGNEQYRQNAFQTAEAGIADSLMAGTFNPAAAPTSRSGGSPDTFQATLAPQLNGVPQPAIWGNKWDSFATYHFQITSVGRSTARNGLATNIQGVAVLAPWDASILPGGGLGTGLCASPPCP